MILKTTATATTTTAAMMTTTTTFLETTLTWAPLFCSPKAGYHKRCGTTFMGSDPEEKDCNLITKLRELGAVIVGTTNMYEIGLGVIGDNPNK